MRKRTQKREMEVAKSWEEYYIRVKMNEWAKPTIDALFRLNALIHYHPNRSDRKIFNLTKLGAK